MKFVVNRRSFQVSFQCEPLCVWALMALEHGVKLGNMGTFGGKRRICIYDWMLYIGRHADQLVGWRQIAHRVSLGERDLHT